MSSINDNNDIDIDFDPMAAPEGYDIPDDISSLVEDDIEIIPETTPVEDDGPLFEARSVSARTMLWGHVGKIFADAPRTAEDAIAEAGLDWDVELRKLGYHNEKGNFVTAPKNFATVRTDTDALLGVVKSRYVPIANREAFDIANVLVDDYDAKIEAAFETHGGKVVGLTMRLPDDVLIGGEEAFGSYLMMRTTHDGSGALKMAISQMRMACLNQFDFNINTAKHRYSIHHTAKATSHIAGAREALEITFKYQGEFQQEVERMMNTQIRSEAARKKLDNILEARRFGDRARQQITNAVEQNLTYSATIPDGHRDTAYGWMNATTEYWEHIRDYRTSQSRYLVNSEGPGFHVRNEFAKELMAV